MPGTGKGQGPEGFDVGRAEKGIGKGEAAEFVGYTGTADQAGAPLYGFPGAFFFGGSGGQEFGIAGRGKLQIHGDIVGPGMIRFEKFLQRPGPHPVGVQFYRESRFFDSANKPPQIRVQGGFPAA
jgi:hypothetical protein